MEERERGRPKEPMVRKFVERQHDFKNTDTEKDTYP